MTVNDGQLARLTGGDGGLGEGADDDRIHLARRGWVSMQIAVQR